MHSQRSVFLTARWENLVMINDYEVDPQILMPYLPPATELDIFENKALVSVVTSFLNTTISMEQNTNGGNCIK